MKGKLLENELLIACWSLEQGRQSGKMLKIPHRRISLSFLRKLDWKRSKGRKFIDWKKVYVCGGSGGNGCVSFKKSSKLRFGGPDGGDGGCGGGVVFMADSHVRDLRLLNTHYRGDHGESGQGSYHTGKSGRDIIIKVPVGTVIKDHMQRTTLVDLLSEGSCYTAAQGGEGGLGNAVFGTVDNRRPVERTEGEQGDESIIEVELRTIADVGMVGFPNAGKSTLLRAISRATPEVAAYPFTTLNPHIGVVADSSDKKLAVADIPGLIPGAHLNKGLGHSFLRHIERCKALLYVLDASSSEPDIHTQLSELRNELKLYDQRLCENVGLIVANKMDLLQDGDEEKVLGIQKESGLPVVPVSALKHWNIEPLKEALFRITNWDNTTCT